MSDKDLSYFENRNQTGYLSDCPYGSTGNVLHWIYVYSSLKYSESVIISGTRVFYGKEKVADFDLDKELKMPIFNFTEKYTFMENNQHDYLEEKGY